MYSKHYGVSQPRRNCERLKDIYKYLTAHTHRLTHIRTFTLTHTYADILSTHIHLHIYHHKHTHTHTHTHSDIPWHTLLSTAVTVSFQLCLYYEHLQFKFSFAVALSSFHLSFLPSFYSPGWRLPSSSAPIPHCWCCFRLERKREGEREERGGEREERERDREREIK